MAFYNFFQNFIVAVIAIYSCWRVMLFLTPTICRFLMKCALFCFYRVQGLNFICQHLCALEKQLQNKCTNCASCNACGKDSVKSENPMIDYSLNTSHLTSQTITIYKKIK